MCRVVGWCVCMCVCVWGVCVCCVSGGLGITGWGWKLCKMLAKSYGTSVDTRKIQLPINLSPTALRLRFLSADLCELFLLDLPFGSPNLAWAHLYNLLLNFNTLPKRKYKEKGDCGLLWKWNKRGVIDLSFFSCDTFLSFLLCTSRALISLSLS